MTDYEKEYKENKQLLLKDLCARLPYGIIVDNPDSYGDAWDEVINIDNSAKTVTLLYNGRVFSIDDIKPYLRPMSSMTEEEAKELSKRYVWRISCKQIQIRYHSEGSWDDDTDCPTEEYLWLFDWLNSHHFDYRGLIPMKLALEAPEGMYNFN